MRILAVLAVFLAVLTLDVSIFRSETVVSGAPIEVQPALKIQSIQPLGEHEIVTIVNLSDRPIELTGWRLESSNSLGREVKQTFWFPRGFFLPPRGVVRVHSGPAVRGWVDPSSGRTETDLPWTAITVWNDKADVAWLRDPSGELVDLYTYTVPNGPLPRPEAERGPGPARPWSAQPGFRWRFPPCPGLEIPQYARPCRPCCLWPTDGCCTVRVILEAIELLYNRGVGENWRFFVSVGPIDPEVSPAALPQVLYEGIFRGEEFIRLGAGALEEDRSPDRGWVQQEFRLCCPLSPFERVVILEVYVREDEPCCSGCIALWRFTFRVAVEPGFPTEVPAPPPQAEFTITPAGERKVGDVVTLDGSPSRGEGLSYSWDFDGDGITDATGRVVHFELTRMGMNLVTLTVTDRWDRSDSLTRGIKVLPVEVKPEKFMGLDLGLFWLTLPALAVGYFLILAFRG